MQLSWLFGTHIQMFVRWIENKMVEQIERGKGGWEMLPEKVFGKGSPFLDNLIFKRKGSETIDMRINSKWSEETRDCEDIPLITPYCCMCVSLVAKRSQASTR